MKKITIAANWKKYLNEKESIDFVKKLNKYEDLFYNKYVDIILFPQAEHLPAVKDVLEIKNVTLGLQDYDYRIKSDSEISSRCHSSGVCLDSCIVGHSERRMLHKEDNKSILEKFHILHARDIYPILCVGETQEQRDLGDTLPTIYKQLPEETPLFNPLPYAIAYEPVWSIGTGNVPSNKEIELVLSRVINSKNQPYLFYGGSVNEDNVEKLLEIDLIDGFLIGGASAKFDSFIQIIKKIN